MEKTDYIVGKWYKRIETYTLTDGYLAYVKHLGFKEDYQKYKECITIGIGYENKNSINTCSIDNFMLLTDLSEIQEWLPDNHVDKIKPSLVGRYIKALSDKVVCIGEAEKGDIFKIIKNNGIEMFKDKSTWSYTIQNNKIGEEFELLPVDYNPNAQTNEQYLLEEAKKRYIPGTKFKSALNDKNPYIGIVVEGMYLEGKNRIWNGDSVGFLYENGNWAEIVEDKEVIFEYVKCTSKFSSTEIGKIYKVNTRGKIIGVGTSHLSWNGGGFKPSTWEAYATQEGLNNYPLTPKECINTFEKTGEFIFEDPYVNEEIEVGDEVEVIQKLVDFGKRGIVLEKYREGYWNISNTNCLYYRNDQLKLIKKASNNTKKVDFSSPKVTDKITVPRINTISRDKLIHINIETNTKSITIPKLETKSSEIKNIKIQSFSLTI